MKVWLFDHIVWPKPGQRTLMPYPGTLWEPQLGMETYEAHLRYCQAFSAAALPNGSPTTSRSTRSAAASRKRGT